MGTKPHYPTSIRLAPDTQKEMEEAIYKLSRPGHMVSQTEYIEKAIQEQNTRVLKGTRSGRGKK